MFLKNCTDSRHTHTHTHFGIASQVTGSRSVLNWLDGRAWTLAYNCSALQDHISFMSLLK